MHTALRAAALVAPFLLLTGCDEFDFGGTLDRYKEDFHLSYTLSAGGRLSIENLNGSVEISSWEKDAVEINGTKYASSPQALKELKIDVTSSPGVLQIRTVPPLGARNTGARFSLRVPKRVQLDRIVSSNGSIRVDDIEGPANLRSSNGSIRIWHTKGTIEARTSNGAIEANGNTGDASLHTSNGSIRVEMNQGALEAGTSNGGINARLLQPDSDRPVRLESSNGHIELVMDAVRDVRANTSNSSITVRLPGGANARVRARTSNSPVTTDFDVLTRGVIGKQSLEGTLGGGGPLIDLSTSNGSIKLLKM